MRMCMSGPCSSDLLVPSNGRSQPRISSCLGPKCSSCWNLGWSRIRHFLESRAGAACKAWPSLVFAIVPGNAAWAEPLCGRRGAHTMRAAFKLRPSGAFHKRGSCCLSVQFACGSWALQNKGRRDGRSMPNTFGTGSLILQPALNFVSQCSFKNGLRR